MLNSKDNNRVFQHAVDQIQKMIMKGQLKKGDRLHSQGALEEALGIDSKIIQEALRALSITGLLKQDSDQAYIVHGQMDDSLLQPISAMFVLNQGSAKDIWEFRTTLEVQAARLAAERVTEASAKDLTAILDDYSDASLETNKAELDNRLHYYIAEMTGNILIINMLQVISKLMETFIQNNRLKILQNPNNQKSLFKHHEDLAEAIIAGKPDEAASAMMAHMKMIEDIVKP